VPSTTGSETCWGRFWVCEPTKNEVPLEAALRNRFQIDFASLVLIDSIMSPIYQPRQASNGFPILLPDVLVDLHRQVARV
jgi:hypothetical protein